MNDAPDPAAVSGVRLRTRQAIVSAAVAAWASDFSTSLSDIADRADVSRSTLHRHFPDRQSLVDAALVEASTILDRQSKEAVDGCESARAELESLMRVILGIGDIIMFLFSDPNRFEGNPEWSEEEDQMLPEILTRAQKEGAIADDLETRWLVGVFYSLCFVGAVSIATEGMSRRRAADVALRTFFSGVSAD
ncbi:TetR/AcrR family transcriptional regulator [Gordonia terrae]